jgi:hypothetical protein
MRRTALVSGLLISCLLLVLLWSFRHHGKEPDMKRSPIVRDRLTQLMEQEIEDFPGIEDARTTLKEAMDALAKEYRFSWDINLKAFEYEGLARDPGVEGTLITEGKPIQAMKRAQIGTIVNTILQRIPVPSGACYMVRQDHIEITTEKFRKIEIWGEDYEGPCLPLAELHLEKQPLREVLRSLEQQTGFNFVLDQRAEAKADVPITIHFQRVPLDSALLLLTDMVDLDVLQRDNVFYLTSRENATALERRLLKGRPLRREDGSPLDPAGWRKSQGHPVRLSGGTQAVGGM